ncbi:MAG: M1 family metallopeptidase, partial [Deltaproteobacteria bacterium]|nr:M1 family metallopeptidase [Deltaproteobacteria bacterium]
MHSSKLLPIALSCAFVAQAAHALADERSATRPAQRPQPPTPTAPRQNPAETQSPAVALPVIDTAPAEIPLMGADFQMIRAPSSPEAFGGPRTGKEPTLADHVADYSLKARLDPVAHTLEGQETLRWRNRSAQPVRTLYFHLYLNGFTNPDSTWMREKAKYGSFRSGVETKKGEWGYIDVSSVMQGDKAARMNFVHPDGGPSTDRSVLRVELPEAVAPGATVELKIAFHDQLPRVIARTGWFGKYHLVGQWFPKIGVLELPGERGATTARWNCHEFHLNSEFYADWGSYDLEVTAPKGYTVEANGLPVGAPKDTPEGTVHTFRADDVHDAVFTAWDGYAAPIEGSYDGPGSPHVQVRVLFPEEYRASGEVALASTIESLKYFSEQLGPYPYKRVVAVLPPYNAGESGGMEYETFFTTDASPYPAVVRYVTIHEFGHGYFMGLLASNEFEEPFLDEGLNELYDTRMIRAGPTRERSKLEKLLDVHLPVFDPFDLERVPGAARTQADPLAESSWHRYSEGAYN